MFVRTADDAPVTSVREAPQRTALSETTPVATEASAEPGSIARANLALERWLAQAAVRLGQLTWQINSDQARATILRVTSHLVILTVMIGAVGMAGAARAATPVERAGRQVASSGEPGRNVSFNVFPAGQPVTNTEEILTFVGQGGPIQIDQAVVVPQANPYTTIPNRQRRDILLYTVQAGDTLFGIAALYGLTPESLLWANFDALQDNPHLLKTGMELNIPPVNGIVYTVESGDTVESIAEKYKATVEAIYQDGYEWNQLKPGQQPQAGATLIIPGGSREFKSWALTQAENAPVATSSAGVPIASNSNAGFCKDVAAGLVGTGAFVWPANEHWVSGNNYAPWHPALDIAAHLGDPIYAADNGVVVYAGWNNWGYGNLVVIDHGNGWQTWYAHNSALYVGCGQNVFQGSTIAAAGSTGRSTGPHLHFETRLNNTLPNPFNVLPPP
ncbi:MAG: peptidoglycan DD-metalloendopeptidase family protein [Chloroflexi bacterium]|nr:peptidoglycan DD-metalloendopeptidase family protein [Chloroflexota bacterium]